MAKFNAQKIIDHLKDKWQNRTCPLCGHGNWNVSDSVYELREFNDGALMVGGAPIVPVVPVTCNNCGNTIMVNAILSGAIETSKKKGVQNDK